MAEAGGSIPTRAHHETKDGNEFLFLGPRCRGGWSFPIVTGYALALASAGTPH